MHSIHMFYRMLLVTSICFFSACKKMIDVGLPADRSISATVFSTDAAAKTALVGLYSNMSAASTFTPYLVSGGMTFYGGFSSDELITNAANATWSPFLANKIPVDNSSVRLDWQLAYGAIYHANAILEGISPSLSTATTQLLQGEAKFVRAFYYFYLVNLFGNVPLITHTAYETNAIQSRTSVDSVYQQIIADLKDAKNSLTIAYPSVGKARPNKWAATALLARAYLYTGQWKEAEAMATEVIASGTYKLLNSDADPVKNLNNVFLANSTEAIWQLILGVTARNAYNTTEGFNFIPASATTRPAFSVRPALLNAFEATDARAKAWINKATVSGVTYSYPYKYKVRLLAPATEYEMILRYAELFLIRSEARAQQNNIAGAQDDLNIIRKRAGLTNTLATTKDALLDAVLNERRLEYFAEYGHRWLDIKRSGKADAIMTAAKPAWDPTKVLFPIPKAERDRDPYLSQNGGY